MRRSRPFVLCVLMVASLSNAHTTSAQSAEAALDSVRTEMLDRYWAGDYGRALALARELVGRSAARPGVASLEYASALKSLGAVLETVGRHGEAMAAYDEALGIYRSLPPGHEPTRGRADVLANVGAVHIARGEYEAAARIFEETIPIYRAMGPAAGVESSLANSLINLAQVRQRQGALGQALALIDEALALFESVEDPAAEYDGYASLVVTGSVLMREAGERERARTALIGARDVLLASADPDPARLGLIEENLAALEAEQGRYANAERAYLEALRLFSDALPPAHPFVLSTRLSLGSLYVTMGRQEDAHRILEELLTAIAGQGSTSASQELRGRAHMTLARMHTVEARYREAEEHHLSALDALARTELGGTELYVTAVQNYAVLLRDLGRWQEAADHLVEALAAARALAAQGARDPGLSHVLINLASTVSVPGTSQAAWINDLFGEALGILEATEGAGGPTHRRALMQFLIHAVDTKQLELAQRLGEQALGGTDLDSLARTGGRQDAELLIAVGNLHLLSQRVDRACESYEAALAIADRAIPRGHPIHEAVRTNLAIAIVRAGGSSRDALELAELALDYRESLVASVTHFSSEAGMDAYVRARFHVLGVALGLLARDASLADRAEGIWRRASATRGRILGALRHYRVALALLQQDPRIAARWAELATLEQRLAGARLAPAVASDELSRLEERARRQEADLNRRLSDRLPRRSADPARAREMLGPQEAIVEYVRFHPYRSGLEGEGEPGFGEPELTAFVVRADTVIAAHLGPARVIDGAVEGLARELRRASLAYTSGQLEERALESQWRAASGRLYALAWAPLDVALSDVQRVFVVPDGDLHRVPFEALVGPDGTYLIERFSGVRILTRSGDLVEARGRDSVARSVGVAVFAAPDFDAALSPTPATPAAAAPLRGDLRGATSWDPLPGTRIEAERIRAALANAPGWGAVRVHLADTASEERLKRLEPPRLLHLGTHGFFLPARPPADEFERQRCEAAFREFDPGWGASRGRARLRCAEDPMLRAGIVLAGANRVGEQHGIEDGWVTAEEISLLDLAGTELVVLSACETGLGDIRTGEGVYGLQRAFRLAGAANLILTLSLVPDAESAELLGLFYDRWAQDAPVADALARAKREVRRRRIAEHGAAHPFFWATYILVGAGDDPSSL